MTTVALVYPPYHFNPPECLQPPLTIAHLYSILEKAGVERIDAIDLDVEFNHSRKNLEYFLKKAVERVESVEPTVVCLTCKSAQFPFSVLFSKKYKRLHSDTKIIMGGWMPTLVPELTLRLSGCDAVVRGEGERSLPELLRKIDDRSLSVDGVSYILRGEQKTIHNPNSIALNQKELDSLPLPRYDVLPPLHKYQPGYRNFSFTVEASRGCTNHRCIFCWNSTKNCATSWRAKSPKKVVSEIRHLVDTYGAYQIFFADDSFGAEAAWLNKFTSLMKDEFFPGEVTYIASMRVDIVDDRLLKQLYKSGLRRVFHGVESGSPRCWKILGKNLEKFVTREYIIELVKKEIKMGIIPICSIMVGLPNEKEKDIDDTISLCRELVRLGSRFALHILYPHEGTALFELYRDLIEPCDVYKEFGQSESFYSDYRAVFGERLKEFFDYLPDNRMVRPSMPLELFKNKYRILSSVIGAPIPPFFGEVNV